MVARQSHYRHLGATYLLPDFPSASVPHMVSTREVDSILEEYDRHYAALSELAEQLKIAPDEADELIYDVLTSTLTSRHISNIDTWLTAAFTSAANHRGGRAS